MKRIPSMALAAGLLLAMTAGWHGNVLAQQSSLGTLFFSPLQRQELDRRRQTNAQAVNITADDLVTINGRVSRSSGKTTTWINGVAQEDTYRDRDPTRVTVPRGEDQEVTLKVGETLDRIKGETRSSVESGAISIRRRQPGR